MADLSIEKKAELRLVDPETQNKVILRPEPSSEDKIIRFPNTDGTLVTDKNLIKVLEEQKVNLAQVPIITPTITNAILDGDVCDTWLKVSEYKTSDTFRGKHVDTEWQASSNYDFTDLLDHSEPTVNKYRYKPRIDIPNQFYYVRCRFLSGDMMSSWSNPRYFITPSQGVKTIKVKITENKLMPTIDIEPIETYGGLEIPEVLKITTTIYKDNEELFNQERIPADGDTCIVPTGILVPDQDYVIKLVVEFKGVETQETYLNYHSLKLYVEKPYLEHYIEEGRKYVRASEFKPVNYEDTHLETHWTILTEGNVEIFTTKTITDLRYLDITDYVDLDQGYIVKCTFVGAASVIGGDWFISKESELYIPPYKAIVEPLTCVITQNKDYSITLNMNKYSVKGEVPDEYKKTVITFYQQSGENYRTLFQIDTDNEIFLNELHNTEPSEEILNIPEHIMSKVSKEIGLNLNDEFFVLVYKVGKSGKRTNSVKCDLINRYKINKVTHVFNKERAYLKISSISDADKIGNIKIESVKFSVTKRIPSIVKGKTVYEYITDTSYSAVRTDLKTDVIIPVKLKFIEPDIEFGISYTIETDKGNYYYSDPIRDAKWVGHKYDYICREPGVIVTGYGLEKTVELTFNGVTGLLPPGDNGEHKVTEVRLYKNNGELIEEFSRTDSMLNKVNLTVDKLHINTSYIVTCRVGTNKVLSPMATTTFSTNNVNISLAGIKGAEGNTIVTKYPSFEVYGYLVSGAVGFGADHYSTTWKLYDNRDMIVWQVEKDTSNLNTITANVDLISGQDYRIEAVAHSRLYGDSNKVSCVIHYEHLLKNVKVPDDLTRLIYGNDDGGIYGKVLDNLISGPRAYVGNWGSEYELRKGSNNEVGFAHHHKYYKGQRVSFRNKLYEALQDHNWKTTNDPEVDKLNWKPVVEDLLLPSIDELVDSLGIAYNTCEVPFEPGATNTFTFWSDKNKIGNVNYDSKWIKMLSPTTKRVCYVLNQCLINEISYNDIVSRFKEYVMVDKFTMVFGTRLYYVRLSTQEEEVLLQKLPANQGIDLNNNVLVCTTAVDKANTVRIVNYAKLGKIKTDTRSCGFRIVITPIDNKEAPYNKIPASFPMPKGQKFLYDKYTDTGYFGAMKMSEFINPKQLSEYLGVTDGTDISNTVNKWFVYYEHGRIVYRPNKPIRSGVTFETLRKLGLVFGTDMGSYHRASKYFFTGEGVSGLFSVELMNTTRFNIISLEPQPKNLLIKVFKTNADLYQKNIGLLNTSSVNLMYRTLTPGYKFLGYGYLDKINTSVFGSVIGSSFTEGTTFVNKNTDLHIGTSEVGYDKLYPFNVNTGTNLIGKGIVVDKDGLGLKSRIVVFNTHDYFSSILYTDSQNLNTYGWLPSLVLV